MGRPGCTDDQALRLGPEKNVRARFLIVRHAPLTHRQERSLGLLAIYINYTFVSCGCYSRSVKGLCLLKP
jgi:hypothetical protein